MTSVDFLEGMLLFPTIIEVLFVCFSFFLSFFRQNFASLFDLQRGLTYHNSKQKKGDLSETTNQYEGQPS